MGKNEWNVASAKQQFCELLRRCAAEPQLIYRHNRLVAAVVSVDGENEVPGVPRTSIAERFEEARKLFREEQYRLPHGISRRQR
jgi:antitoxin (DNA-binding transcriptional repressor) of toxin-antitoxin stability system